MTHRDIDSLAERLKRAREMRKANRPTARKYNKRNTGKTLTPSKKRELMENVRICKEAKDRANLELDAVILQSYKAGLSIASISEAMGVNSHSYVYRKVQQLEADFKAGKEEKTSSVEE